MQEQWEEKPFRYGHGEMLLPDPPAPAPADQGLVILPWPEEERRREAARLEEPQPRPSALEAMKAANEVYDPPAWEPPAAIGPLERFVPPKWTEEQRRAEQLAIERQEAVHRARVERALAEEEPGYPPPRREPA
jgi:hypothetical protein